MRIRVSKSNWSSDAKDLYDTYRPAVPVQRRIPYSATRRGAQASKLEKDQADNRGTMYHLVHSIDDIQKESGTFSTSVIC